MTLSIALQNNRVQISFKLHHLPRKVQNTGFYENSAKHVGEIEELQKTTREARSFRVRGYNIGMASHK